MYRRLLERLTRSSITSLGETQNLITYLHDDYDLFLVKKNSLPVWRDGMIDCMIGLAHFTGSALIEPSAAEGYKRQPATLLQLDSNHAKLQQAVTFPAGFSLEETNSILISCPKGSWLRVLRRQLGDKASTQTWTVSFDSVWIPTYLLVDDLQEAV